jgi:hypothetical protein
VCAVRKSQIAVERAQRRITRKQQQHKSKAAAQTRECACYVTVFTTLLETEADSETVMECYRLRWQIELMFKRLKSIVQLGHLPKRNDRSSRAWMAGGPPQAGGLPYTKSSRAGKNLTGCNTEQHSHNQSCLKEAAPPHSESSPAAKASRRDMINRRMPLRLLCLSLIALGAPLRAQTGDAATVVLDAAAFLEHMPKGTILAGGGRGGGASSLPPGASLFNNMGLVMRSQAYIQTRAEIPESGTWHLFVRSHGTERSSFRVLIGDKQTAAVFGNEPLTMKPGGAFELEKGKVDVTLSRVVLGGAVGSTFDVLVLTKNAAFREQDLARFELHPDVSLLKEYTIPRSSAVKFGDVDGDGKSDFLVLTSNYAAHMFDHSGRELWSYQNEQEGAKGRAGFESPGLLWDFDSDGTAEAVTYRLTEGKEWLTVADGKTGAILRKTEWPTIPMPHEYNNFRLAVARLRPTGHPSDLLVFTDSGGVISITAYDRNLKQLWQHVEKRLKDHLGHYVYAVDLDKDGADEVIASPFVLNASGKVVWNRFDLLDDNHDHWDSIRFHDLDGDGRAEILAPSSEIGVMVFRARDGALLWRHPAEHTQQLEAGNFLRGVPGPHVAANARTYARNGEAGLGAQVHWFDANGNLLSKWPANPLNGNPDFVRGDWRGDGSEDLFWYRFRLTNEGKGALFFKQDVYHMLDFMGTGAEQVIARGGTTLQVYGYKGAKPRAVKRDAAYKKRIANHTHY